MNIEIRGAPNRRQAAAIVAALVLFGAPGSEPAGETGRPGPWIEAVPRFERHPGPVGWSPLGRRPR